MTDFPKILLVCDTLKIILSFYTRAPSSQPPSGHRESKQSQVNLPGSLNILLNYASAQTHNPYQQSKQPDMLADFAGLAGFHINRTTRRKDDGLAVLFDKKRSKPGHFCRRVKK
jgi:hypothetical protein